MFFCYGEITPEPNKEQAVQIESGKYYKTRDGQKAFVACVRTDIEDKTNNWSAIGYLVGKSGCEIWAHDGWRLSPFRVHEMDLIEEWREPITVDRWVNLFADKSVTVTTYDAPGGMIGRKLVKITEGVFE